MKKKRVHTDAFSKVRKLPPVIPQIDLLKALAIFFVITLHSFSSDFYLSIGGAYYIWQAVPLLLVISGFTIAYSYQRYGSATIKQCYDPVLIIKRYKRLLIPFFLCWIIEIIVLIHLNKFPADTVVIIMSFFKGGFGWGAYFIPVILQSVIIVPVLYILALRNPERMVIFALVITILFDIATFLTGWDTAQTSLIYFRFLFAGALGVWIVTTKNRWNIWMILGIAVSFVYIAVCSYTSVLNAFPDYHGYGGALQAPGFVWAAFLVLLGLKFLPGQTDSGVLHYFGEIGKASYHIFLVQMIYFMFPAEIVYSFIDAHLMVIRNFVFYVGITIVCDILVCTCIGFSWYYLEKRVIKGMQKPSPS